MKLTKIERKEINKERTRVKRLAKNYAETYAETLWIGNRPPEEGPEIMERFEEAKEKFYEAIDLIISFPPR